MKILFVVPYVPSRIRIRPYEFIRWLGRQGHSVTVATQWSQPEEQAHLEEIRPFCDQVFAVKLPRWRSFLNSAFALPGRAPLQSVYSWNPPLAQKLLTILDGKNSTPKFDLAHVEHIRGVQFGLFLTQYGKIPVVWDSVDCISLLFQQSAKSNPRRISRLLNQFDLPRTIAFERKIVHQFRRVLVTSPVDRQAFLDLQPAGAPVPKIEVVPQGVDLEYFTQADFNNREVDTVVVSGKMSYHANIRMVLHLVNEIMPLVWKQRPQVKVWVVGKDPSSEILQLAQDQRIIVTGEVDDMRPYLQKATVAVAPTRYGAGIQNKVLEAMACATPVVASLGAVSALQAKPGEDLMTAATPEEFAEAIINLLQNPTHANQIGQAGRWYVERQHQWVAIVNKLESIYTDVIVEEGKK
jgi:sugar transferase (PEP-CTERM/EpsH1 system associated)